MKYSVTAPLWAHLIGAPVRLSAEQAFRRRHLIKPAGKRGFFEVVVPFQFKAGETFEVDVELAKGFADQAIDLRQAKLEAEAAAEAEAKARAEAEAKARAEAEAKARAEAGGN